MTKEQWVEGIGQLDTATKRALGVDEETIAMLERGIGVKEACEDAAGASIRLFEAVREQCRR